VNGKETSKVHELALTQKIVNSSFSWPDPAEQILSILKKFMSHSTVILKMFWIMLHGKKTSLKSRSEIINHINKRYNFLRKSFDLIEFIDASKSNTCTEA